MNVLKWVALIGAGWFLLAVLITAGWSVVVSDIKRTPRPKPPERMSRREAEGLLEIVRLDAELRGRGDR
jgi:hypothetical protein